MGYGDLKDCWAACSDEGVGEHGACGDGWRGGGAGVHAKLSVVSVIDALFWASDHGGSQPHGTVKCRSKCWAQPRACAHGEALRAGGARMC